MHRLSSRAFGQCVLLLAICSIYLYLPALDFSFVADDHIYLALNNTFLYKLPASELWRLAIQRANPWEFLPLRDFTYWLDINLFGLDADGFHASNLIWYALVCWSVFFAARSVFRVFCNADEDQIFALAMTSTLLFAMHPAHVESVAWISGRKELVSGFFCFLALWRLLEAIRQEWPLKQLVSVTLLWLFACFSKGVVASLLPVFFLLAVGASRRLPPASARRVGAYMFALTVVACLAVLVHAVVGRETGIQISNDPGRWAVLERASRILATLLSILAAPNDLRLLYDVYALPTWQHWALSITALLAMCYAVLRLLVRRSGGVLSVAVVMLLVPLLPYLQFLPFTTWSLASERFVFLSVFGLALAGATLLLRLPTKGASLVVVAMISFAWGAVSYTRLPEWDNEFTLKGIEVKYSPAYYNAVRVYVQGGLLPRRRDALALSLVNGVEDPSAKALLVEYVRLAQRQRTLQDSFGHNTLDTLRDFCKDSWSFSEQLRQSRSDALHNPDVVITNFLDSLLKEVSDWRKAFSPRCKADDLYRN